jgi:O-antigen/teichoic acid export membrane protein/methylase of polypeptide subunit release factors
VIGIARLLPANSLLRRGATLALSNGIGQALAFTGSVIIARLMGVEGFGHYAALMAVAFVLGLLVEAGLETTLTREVAGEEYEQTWNLLKSSLIAKLCTGTAVSIILALPPVAAFLAPDPSVRGAVQLAGPLITLGAFNSSFAAVFRAWGQMSFVLLINVVGLSIQLMGTVLLLLVYGDLTVLLAWLVAVQAVELCMGVLLFRRGATALQHLAPPHEALTGKTETKAIDASLAILKRSWPFALSGVLSALTLRVDLFLIEGLRGSAQVGIYSTGTRLTDLLALVPNSFFGALLPEMSVRYKASTSSGAPLPIYGRALWRMALVGLTLALVGLLGADLIVWVCFGPAFAEAAGPLRVLAIALVPLLVNRTTLVGLYATHQEHKANLALTVNLATRIVVGILLIPLWSATGAAITALVAECVVTSFFWLTGAMAGSNFRRAARAFLRFALRLRFRGFQPGAQPDHTVKVVGMRLKVHATVFDPSLHFTSAYLAEYLSRDNVVRPGSQVLDLGTGSGIAALVAARSGAGGVVATDINPAAIGSVEENAQAHGSASIITARQGDMFAPVGGEQFDLIISNPPYFRGTPNNIAEQAYMGGAALEWFHRFVAQAPKHLRPGGRVIMVLGDAADVDSILALFTAAGWHVRLAARSDRLVETLLIYELSLETR